MNKKSKKLNKLFLYFYILFLYYISYHVPIHDSQNIWLHGNWIGLSNFAIQIEHDVASSRDLSSLVDK